MQKRIITVYTDGACQPNPGYGGWAAIIIEAGKKDIVLEGGEAAKTTNNRMELTGPIEALRNLPIGDDLKITIYSDSQYVINVFVKSWIKNWKKNGWVNAKKEPVKNKDLIIELSDLVDKYSPNWIWVKGHNGDQYNEMVDKPANAQAAMAQQAS